MLQAAARITTISKKPDGFFTEWCLSCRALTGKLNGRPEAQRARQSDSTLKAHQAPSHAEFHGPLERTHRAYCARAAFSRATKDDAVTK